MLSEHFRVKQTDYKQRYYQDPTKSQWKFEVKTYFRNTQTWSLEIQLDEARCVLLQCG